jgi:hypothetical protein
MSQTVIVAAITAVSTLAGSAIAAVLALRSARQQIDLQAKLSDKEHDEKRSYAMCADRRI